MLPELFSCLALVCYLYFGSVLYCLHAVSNAEIHRVAHAYAELLDVFAFLGHLPTQTVKGGSLIVPTALCSDGPLC